MTRQIKTEDKWRVYAFYGEPDDLRMDGIEPETTYDHLLDDDSHSLDVTSKEAVFYQENGYEPQESPTIVYPWPTPRAGSLRLRLSTGSRWQLLAAEVPELVGNLFRATNCETLSFDAFVQTIEGKSVVELSFKEANFEMVSFHAFKHHHLNYWLKAVEGARFTMVCARSAGDTWFCDPETGEPICLGQMLDLPRAALPPA